ncbi:MAG: hypothetical protein H7144_01685, partial [Burkholderiales bacterium]|nr:hypothetical protein [Phycisphaerae bacterium]
AFVDVTLAKLQLYGDMHFAAVDVGGLGLETITPEQSAQLQRLKISFDDDPNTEDEEVTELFLIAAYRRAT